MTDRKNRNCGPRWAPRGCCIPKAQLRVWNRVDTQYTSGGKGGRGGRGEERKATTGVGDGKGELRWVEVKVTAFEK